MANTYVLYPGQTGSTTDYSIPFEYLSRDFVKATVNGVDAPFSFLSSNMIRISTAPVGDLRIFRSTPTEELINTYADGSILIDDDLNESYTQTLHVSEEMHDKFSAEIARTPKLPAGSALDISIDPPGVGKLLGWSPDGKRLIPTETPVNEKSQREAAINALASLIGQSGPIETQVFDSRLAASLSVIKPTVGSVRTGGYSTPGDGGAALYKRVGTEPSHVGKFQSTDGSWWEIAETTLTPQMFGAVADGVTDDTAALVAWAAFLSQGITNSVSGECKGSYGFTAGTQLVMTDTTVEFSATFNSIGTSEVGLEILATRARWFGMLRVVVGPGNQTLPNYAASRSDIAVRFRSSSRCTIDQVSGVGARYCAVQILSGTGDGGGTSNMATFNYINSTGSGTSESYFNQVPDAITNTGSAGSASQRCEIAFPSALPPSLRVGDLININGEDVSVMSIDFGNNQVTCFPQLVNTSLTTANFAIGAGCIIQGGDANVIRIGVVDVTRSGVALWVRALYGPHVDAVHGNLVRYALQIGAPINNANINGTVQFVYKEGDNRHVIESTTGAHGWRVGVGSGNAATELKKLRPVGAFSADFRTRTQTQRLSISDDVSFNSLTLSRSNSVGAVVGTGNEYRHKFLGTPSSTRYLLICRGFGHCYVNGVFYGKTNPGTNRSYATVRVNLSGGSSSSPIGTWSHEGTSAVNLVSLTFNGNSYIAIDAMSTGPSAWAGSFFSGVAQEDDANIMQWVTPAAVSDVLDYDSWNSTLSLRDYGQKFMTVPGPYADDAAAASAGVEVGETYRKASGEMAWRVI